ncbi:MAG: glycosyltransferase family 4 protein [Aphanocapsa sp. GSE-SYN-MK-11-07L]|jgi:glycosyltransferase involved in cell wall biosynthesis|nr:glycosyltransferase family 4 protein [Aphanocapsa sp. GSE-SYN-MK-11-07L]
MEIKIGYLIPEFPGQTHNFFWKERQALAELGVSADLISTRLPHRGISSHAWSDQAILQTSYLVPFSIADFSTSAIALLQAGPRGWLRCLTTIAAAKELSLAQKFKLLAMAPVAAKLSAIAARKKFTHIHVHSCAESANIALLAAQLFGLTYSLTLHGPTLELYGSNQAEKWRHALFAVVISQKLLDSTKLTLAGSLPDQLEVAPMGVNLEIFQRQTTYQPWSPAQTCRIFSCGRLNLIKGHKYLLQAMILLQQRGIKVKLQIAGEDEQGGNGYHQELAELIREQGLSESVELMGAVSEDQIRQGLEEAHIFALASLNEGVPVAVMEAMAMELPVVVTQVGGNAELIDQGVDGLMVAPKDPESLANTIEKVLKESNLAIALSQAARRKIIAKFSHKRSAEVIALNLRQVLANE